MFSPSFSYIPYVQIHTKYKEQPKVIANIVITIITLIEYQKKKKKSKLAYDIDALGQFSLSYRATGKDTERNSH